MNTPTNTIKTIKEIPIFQALDKKNTATATIHCQKHGVLSIEYYSFLGKPVTCPLCKKEKEAAIKAAEAEKKPLNSSSSTEYVIDTSMPLLKITSRKMKKHVRYSKSFRQSPFILNKKLFCCMGIAGRGNHI